MSTRTFGDLSVKDKTTFLIKLAALRLMERRLLLLGTMSSM
jgi:hypothetical protein